MSCCPAGNQPWLTCGVVGGTRDDLQGSRAGSQAGNHQSRQPHAWYRGSASERWSVRREALLGLRSLCPLNADESPQLALMPGSPLSSTQCPAGARALCM